MRCAPFSTSKLRTPKRLRHHWTSTWSAIDTAYIIPERIVVRVPKPTSPPRHPKIKGSFLARLLLEDSNFWVSEGRALISAGSDPVQVLKWFNQTESQLRFSGKVRRALKAAVDGITIPEAPIPGAATVTGAYMPAAVESLIVHRVPMTCRHQAYCIAAVRLTGPVRFAGPPASASSRSNMSAAAST